MSKRTRDEGNIDTAKAKRRSGSTKNAYISKFEEVCPSREKMFYLLEEGDLKTFSRLAPIYALQMDKDSEGNTFLHRLVLKCSAGGYEKMQNLLNLILEETPALSFTRNNAHETPLMLACKEAISPELIVRLAEASPLATEFEDERRSIPLFKFLSHVKVGRKPGEMSAQKCCLVLETLLYFAENVNHEDYGKKNALNHLLKRKDLCSATISEIAKVLFKYGAKLVTETGKHAFKCLATLHENLIYTVSQYCPSELLKKDSKNWTVVDYILRDRNIQRRCSESSYSSDDWCSGRRSRQEPDHMKFESEELLKSLKIIYENSETIENSNELISIAAKRNCDYKIIHYLINKTPNFKITGYCHSTLLVQYATTAKIVSELLHYGADPNKLNSRDVCALITAAKAKNSNAITKLIEAGADPLEVVNCSYNNTFFSYITQDLNLMKFLLDHPKFKDSKNLELVSQFNNALIELIYNHFQSDDQKMVIEKLELILSQSKSENVNLLTKVGSKRHYMFHQEREYWLEPIGALFQNTGIMIWCKLRNQSYVDKLYSFVDIMLNIKLKETNWPENVVTPLTALLKESDNFYLDKLEADSRLVPLMDLLIEKGGVDVGSTKLQDSFAACSEESSKPNYGKELMIPDVLDIAIKLRSVIIIKKFISYWWGPPIALTAMLNSLHHEEKCSIRKDYFCKEIHALLLKYDEIPHGTSLLSKSVWEGIKSWHITLKQLQEGDIIEEFSVVESPASLQVLCKYAVRHMFAERASQTGTNLPKLLSQVLPPLLKRVVIH